MLSLITDQKVGGSNPSERTNVGASEPFHSIGS